MVYVLYIKQTFHMKYDPTSTKGLSRWACVVACSILLAPVLTLHAATTDTAEVEAAWRLLDYIAIDYAGSVNDGEVISPTEFAEQVEFSAVIAEKLKALAPTPAQKELLEKAEQLQRLIAHHAEPNKVSAIAHNLADGLLAAYPIPLAPATPPDLVRGKNLFEANCAACHGTAGDGLGPAIQGLEVPPIAFTDAARARQRSLLGLYQVISQGLDGTAMRRYDYLPTRDRWALAFYVGQFAFPSSMAEGKLLWSKSPALHNEIPDLKTLVTLTPAALAERVGEERANALTAYLRSNPAVFQPAPSPLALARSHLSESLSAYQAGDRAKAAALALSAYLDGFEPLEPTLATRNNKLMTRIEGAMGEYRSAIQRGADAGTLSDRSQQVEGLLAEAENVLAAASGSPVSTLIGAATILLREGLEALLIVVAMLAFLRQAGQEKAAPYVHAGWVGALVAGLLTWAAATWFIRISGASRELTEGFGSVLAALVLVFVGIWMHGKSRADQWQRYIRERTAKALSGRSAWFLFGLAFVVVYREVFETILFFVALWAEGNGGALLAGAASATLLLAAIAWMFLRYSRSLPIGKFFSYSSWLMAALAIILAGKGISALQEAGFVGVTILHDVPRSAFLGFYPTTQTIIAQALVAIAVIISFNLNRAPAHPLPGHNHIGPRSPSNISTSK